MFNFDSSGLEPRLFGFRFRFAANFCVFVARVFETPSIERFDVACYSYSIKYRKGFNKNCWNYSQHVLGLCGQSEINNEHLRILRPFMH